MSPVIHSLTGVLVLLACGLDVGCGGGVDGAPDGGDDLAPPPACSPTSPRPGQAQLFVEPDDGAQPVVALIDAATSTIELAMYELSTTAVVKALSAAATRGVKLRVILDAGSDNSTAQSALVAAGAEVRQSAPAFPYMHEKAMVVDGKTALVFSGNFNDYSFGMERNYGIIEDDIDDVRGVLAVFEADWNGTAPDLSCTRLIVSPQNARERLLAFIGSAQQTLDVESLYVTDPETAGALRAAHARGVKLRVLLNDPAWGYSDASTGLDLVARGIDARRSGNLFIHAKLLIVDGAAAFIGSQNFSATSLDRNRELGLVMGKSETSLPRIVETFEGDFASSPSF